MHVSLKSLILALIAVLTMPFLAALALFLLFLDFLYLFRRAPNPGGNAAPERKVLVVQSADPSFILRALDLPDNKPLFQKACLTLFCRDRSEILKPFAGHPMLDAIKTHSETRGWWKHFGSLRKEHFDAVAVFFTGPALGGRERFALES